MEVSADGTTWHPAATVGAGDGDVDEVYIEQPNTTRYVRMHGVKRGTGFGYSLWEMEVRAAA